MTSTLQTIIHSNGSKWAGEAPDSIEKLIDVLGAYDLNLVDNALMGFVTFQDSNGYGNRYYEEHTVCVSGSFNKISHVFNITGVYNNLLPLIKAIEDNIKRQCKLAEGVECAKTI